MKKNQLRGTGAETDKVEQLPESAGWSVARTPPQLRPGEVHVWRFKLEPETETELEAYRRLLNEEETRRTDRFYFQRDRQKFAVGRAILRTILSLYLNQAPQTLQFEYGPQGKPFLAPGCQPGPDRLEFNLSHSYDLALLALTLNRPVGVDLEFVKEDRNVSTLTGQVFTVEERLAFIKIPAALQKEAFYNAWTRKEAYLKACGSGFSFGLDQLEVSFDPSETARILRIKGEAELANGWSVAAIQPGPEYKAAVVVEGGPPALTLWDWQRAAL